jgi:hypothetical protein
MVSIMILLENLVVEQKITLGWEHSNVISTMFLKTLGWETIPMMDFKNEFWKNEEDEC